MYEQSEPTDKQTLPQCLEHTPLDALTSAIPPFRNFRIVIGDFEATPTCRW